MIGMGIRLDRMADIRRLFGKEPDGSHPIGTQFCAPVHAVKQPVRLHQKAGACWVPTLPHVLM